PQHRERRRRARLLALDEPAHYRHPAVAAPVGQGAAQRSGLHLLGGALGVRAGHRAVDRAAAGVLRRPQRALAGPARALLPVRLLAAPPDPAPRLRAPGAPPAPP